MQTHLKELRDFVQARNFKNIRREVCTNLRSEYKKQRLSTVTRLSKLLEYMCSEETPKVFENEK